MSEEDQPSNSWDAYDDLACAILDDEAPNVQNGMDISNAEMAESVCALMGWESFDLLEPIDFDTIYKNGAPNQVLAYFYMAHLRFELFTSASIGDIGDQQVNAMAVAHAEYWYLMLRDKYDAMYVGVETKHTWKN